jgi:hypothetical protein
MPPLEPDDLVDRLKLCLTRRKLTRDVDAALRDTVVEIQRLHAKLAEANEGSRYRKLARAKAKAAKRETDASE